MTAEQPVNPIAAGLKGRCPVCGEGDLFAGYLTVASECESCGADLSKADSGDGPAVFVMFVVGFIVVPLALVLEVALSPPIWLHLLLWIPLATVLTLMLLRPFKGVMITLQFHNKAEEARFEDDEGQG
ncbi:MAG: DUF983 domain-containing protein [Maricaulaceae bacterium]|jgi:uncharacterized protein (DUF983 family)